MDIRWDIILLLFIMGCFVWQAVNSVKEARANRRTRQRDARQREMSKQRLRRLWIVDDPDSGVTIHGRQFHTNLYDQDENP